MTGAMIYRLLYNNWLFWFSFGVLYCSAGELGTLRSLNASAKQSTTFRDTLHWKASRAVDGSNRTDSDKCQCCSATVFQTNPWLQIDLGRYYRLGSFEVFARSDKTENVWGMDVFFTNGGNWSDNYEANITLPTNNSYVRYFNTTLADPVIARYVTMVLPRYDLLVVCEVNIYSKDCQAGTYGLYCNETCGRCQGSDICDSVFGNCSFCEPGYIGTYCKTECPERNFGQNCSSLCHCHGNQTCNRVNGSCPGDRCDLGWRGSNCSNECEPGTYGENCLQTCGHCHLNETCDRRTGNCTLCSSGYTGTKCDTECQNKKYGFNCSMTCGNCQGPCEVSSGTCNTPCQPGYTGPFCNKTCAHGTYGQNCSMACGMCANNKTCDIFNGYCVACAENYNGPMCVTGSETPHSDDSSVTLIAVGVVAGFVISIVLVVVIILVLRRRNKGQSESKDVSFVAIKSVLKRNEPQKGSSIDDNDAVNAKVTLDRRSEEILAAEEVDEPVGDMHDYYSFEPKKISVTQLWDYINDIIDKENDTFGDEFELLGKCPIHLATIGNAEINIRKNKYKDIRAYDHTRVILQREDLEKTDYINANYILGYDKKVKFIASQGPTQAMLTDFLLMIIQQKCSIVVMLTNVFELGVSKCLQYWPEEGKSMQFEDIVVTTQSVDVHNDYDIRLLELKWNGSSHVVKQFHFRSWPDKDVPDSVWCLVNFWRAVDSTAALVTTPVLVHCRYRRLLMDKVYYYTQYLYAKVCVVY